MPFKDPEIRRAAARRYKQKSQLNPVWRARKAAAKQRYRAAHPDYVARQRALVVALGRTSTNVANAARQAVYRAIRSGILRRPGSCEDCGAYCKPDAAHYDYADPIRVRWLCRSCHARWDHAEPKGGYRNDHARRMV